ncbi:GrpB family protein [Paenibacillus wynnii]|uniref:GrpB family protein n=1 Tax=Paenibacillus wynnii TaxID=268407 RepID=UPI000691A9C9|nr:GrpB family protein [Paenibacillus wynnii]
MKSVHFYDHRWVCYKAQQLFMEHRVKIKQVVPEADIQHIGSTAIPGTLTKGDLDIQVRVTQEQFHQTVKDLSILYSINHGSSITETFQAMKDDSTDPPLGIQVTVMGSDFDFFHKIRDVLLRNESYRRKYDQLKIDYEGRDMNV